MDHVLLHGPPGLGKTTLAISLPMNWVWALKWLLDPFWKSQETLPACSPTWKKETSSLSMRFTDSVPLSKSICTRPWRTLWLTLWLKQDPMRAPFRSTSIPLRSLERRPARDFWHLHYAPALESILDWSTTAQNSFRISFRDPHIFSMFPFSAMPL